MTFTNPWLHGLVWGAAVITALMVAVTWITWFERKFAGRIQSRLGPTLVGPAGLLQPVADALKALQKEAITPRDADRGLFLLAPPLTLALALGTAAVIPFAPGVQVADPEVGLLVALALSGLLSFPIWMAGWASNNKYALLGSMRMAAQGISYEIPMILSALVPVALSGSLRLSEIVAFQERHGWFALWPPGLGLVAFALFFATSLAEGNRIPFDIPEAESELVAGPTTEYNAIQWSLFAAAEYAHSVITCALATTLFLGGWAGPLLPPLAWMLLKTAALFTLVTWVRWSLLRFRSDQLMALCWRTLVPLSLALLVAAGVWAQVGGPR